MSLAIFEPNAVEIIDSIDGIEQMEIVYDSIVKDAKRAAKCISYKKSIGSLGDCSSRSFYPRGHSILHKDVYYQELYYSILETNANTPIPRDVAITFVRMVKRHQSRI